MRIQKIVCDRCKKEIQEDPAKFYVERVDAATGDYSAESVCPDLSERDFCSECTQLIIGWFKMQCSLPREEVLMAGSGVCQEAALGAGVEAPEQKKHPEEESMIMTGSGSFTYRESGT